MAINHFPIITHILLPQEQTNLPPSYNCREMDWEEYKEKLIPKLRRSPDQPIINNIDQLNVAISDLTSTLQETTSKVVKWSKPQPDAKRWWNGELIKMKKRLN